MNTIGRDSASLGHARVAIGDQVLETEKNWVEVKGLKPDSDYGYELRINGKVAGTGALRTWPVRANRLVFFVIGDYGNGSAGQRAIADAMRQEFERRRAANDPVRFVITTGDNIYADLNLGYLIARSGTDDRDWGPKFFAPYENLVRHIPFLPSLGNHDGNASESRSDLTTYLDNFFFPGNQPARWYTFQFGGMAEFLALDSTENTTGAHTAPAYAPDGDQSRWLARALGESKAPWKIPYFHHPPFNAGPGHGESLSALRHWVDLFTKTGVKVVFSGHEHNFQFSENSDATGHIRYVISGAGGELRPANVSPTMGAAHIEGWSPVRHFLTVEIDGSTMRITPMSNEQVTVREASGKEIPMPLVVR